MSSGHDGREDETAAPVRSVRPLPWQAPLARARRRSAVGGVVLGGDFLGLGIARSLGRRGAPVVVLDDGNSISRYSRYVNETVRVPSMFDEQRAVEIILDVGRRLGLQGWVLFPTRDETVAALARHRARLEETFRVPVAPWSAVRCAWDKRNTYRTAEELGIPAPRTVSPVDVAELEAANLQLPLVIKPAIKEHFFPVTNVKAWQAESREELVERFLEASAVVPPGEAMVQELVPGDGLFSYCALFKDGEALASMVVRRWRQHPPDFGIWSTYVETIDLPELEAASERFLRAIDYYGLVEVEYKRDARDGRYKILDVNARAWAYHALGPAAGVEFPALLYADSIGEPVPRTRARPGVTWSRLIADLPIGVLNVARGRADPRAFARSIARLDAESVFTRRDPMPSLAEVALTSARRVARLASRGRGGS